MSKKLWTLWASELYTEKTAESVKDKLWALWSNNLNGQPQESIVETTTVLEPALGEEVEVAAWTRPRTTWSRIRIWLLWENWDFLH
jgi:hypothetical protein